MPERAHVTSVAAIDQFRASLILFSGRARAAIEEVRDEVQRTQAWLDQDRRSYWQNELRRRQRLLDEAEQELFSAKISRLLTQTAAQVLAVERAKRAVHEAEEKREAVRRWAREIENRTAPLLKQMEQLQDFVGTDLSKATTYLATVVQLLEGYAATGTASEAVGPTLSGAELLGEGESDRACREAGGSECGRMKSDG
jgi:hypothetical protein